MTSHNFLSNFSKTEGCWLWRGYIDAKGYGRFYLGGTNVKAHRFSYEYFRGKIPDGLHVLHSCDTRNCVNPEHLRIGTNAENVVDRESRNPHRLNPSRFRRRRGEQHPSARLSPDDVLLIRAMWKERAISQKKIAALFGINQATVSEIGTRRKWAHL